MSALTTSDHSEIHDMKEEEEDDVSLEPNCSEPLGLPLPRDEHACSVSLPTWSSVVGYEEGDESIISAMRCAYPRFLYHPLILRLMSAVVDKHSPDGDEDCLLLPGHAAAVRCQAFLQQALEGRKTGEADNALLCWQSDTTTTTKNQYTEEASRIRIVPVGAANVHAVLFPADPAAGTQAKAYWQHTGEIVSSRRAEAALTSLGVSFDQTVTCGPNAPYIYHGSSCEEKSSSSSSKTPDVISSRLRQRIAEWTGLPSHESVFLAPSGMASIYTALRSARRYQLLNQGHDNSRGGRAIVYGFPYLDTRKMCSREELCPDGVDFFGFGNKDDLKLLEDTLRQHQISGTKVSALFTEVPSNPLLQCPDLHALRRLADEYDFCLIVDDTIGNFLNIDVMSTGLADAVCTSLTKIVSGRGDAMAGSIVTNPHTPRGRWMQRDLEKEYSNTSNDTARGLFPADAKAILNNSADFEERNQTINETSEVLADWLVSHSDVETVWYPKYAPLYPSLLQSTPSAGYGGLMSILLASHVCQRTFYDTLDVAKGPSLGTNFTLVCPYTLLAHFHELDFAMRYNVSPNLLRISVGLEHVDLLKGKFDEAFGKSRLHPKLQLSAAIPNGASASVAGGQRRSYATTTSGFGLGTRSSRTNGSTSSSLRTIQSVLKRFPR